MADFLDVNVWVAITAVDHAFHRRAEVYWRNESEGPLCFCRITALGLVRVISNQHTFGGDPLGPTDAWNSYRNWLAQSMVGIADEPEEIEKLMANWINAGLATRRNLTDLYLAAFAVAGSYRLVTFDKDFKVFPGLNLLLLEE